MHLVCLVCLESLVSSFTLHPSNPCRSPLQWAALLFHRALWHDVEAKLMYAPLQQVRCLLVLSITPSYLWGECMVWIVWIVRTIWCLWSDHPPILSSRVVTLKDNKSEVKGNTREAISKRFMLAVRGLGVGIAQAALQCTCCFR